MQHDITYTLAVKEHVTKIRTPPNSEQDGMTPFASTPTAANGHGLHIQISIGVERASNRANDRAAGEQHTEMMKSRSGELGGRAR